MEKAYYQTINVVVQKFHERILSGMYDQVHWTLDGKGKKSEKLFPFNPKNLGLWQIDFIDSEEPLTYDQAKILCEQRGNNWQIAEVEHLLAVGEQLPDLQLESPIVALNAKCVIDRICFVMRLYATQSKDRYCVINPKRGKYKAGTKFLIVRPLPLMN